MDQIDKVDAKTANYVCSATAFVVLSLRLFVTRHRDKKFDIASILTAISMVVLIVRLVVVYYYLRYGTSQDYLKLPSPPSLSSDDLADIRTGSILAIVARVLITTFYWLQICLLLLFYSAMVRDFHWINTIKACWILIVITYIVVVIITFTECRPFRLYWQIDPQPGRCVRAYAQLLTQGICNIVLDLFLLAISWPLIKVKKRSWSQKLRVGTLFLIGFFCIITTCLRIAYIYAQDSYQPVRSFWASVQLLVSTFVANAPTIYGCLQLQRRKKSEQRKRRASRPEPWSALAASSPVAPTSSRPPPTPDLAPVHFDEIDSSSSAASPGPPMNDEKAWSRHVS